MRNSHWLWIVGLLGSLGVAGCCQSRTGEGTRLCLMPGFLRSNNVSATIPAGSPGGPIVYENTMPSLPSSKEGKSEKSPPKMPPVTDLPAVTTPSQRLTPPPPRVPVETSSPLKVPLLPRPSELPNLPPLAAPPEANLKSDPGEGTLIIPTDHVVEKTPAQPEILQIGNVDVLLPASAVKGCEGEAEMVALVKAKAGKAQPVVSATLPDTHAKSEEATSTELAAATRTLSGKVQQWRGAWILRYASVDAVDEHGGSVALFGPAALDGLREGQQVSVQGVLIPAEIRHESPRFRVTRIVTRE